MFGCECWGWSRVQELDCSEPQLFSLPSPLPQWPQGQGFASRRINLGELEVHKITSFKRIWNYTPLFANQKGVTFYRPVEIPDGFFCLGHYCQPDNQPLRGYVIVARDTALGHRAVEAPALRAPINYKLMWKHDDHVYIWLPNPPEGYKAMGLIVTDKAEEPDLEEVRCVREDLTETCETSDLMVTGYKSLFKDPIEIWNIRPSERGMLCRGVPVGSFFCGTSLSSDEDLNISCLKNLDPTLHAMPNLDQIHALIRHYGPTVFFHPNDVYMPSSVQWFFKNGALLYQKGKLKGERINYEGSNLPRGGTNDGEYWLDLCADDEARNLLKKGNLESAELYVHVKPAMGGTFTDLAMWVFCPFNGPATLKLGFLSIAMDRIGQHVCDWEHFTLRVSNFTGELWSVYFSQHSGGEWVNAYDLEFIEGNRSVVYSSKCGHASFPHPGTYLQGSSKLGIGVRNDAAQSEKFVDSSRKYKIIAAEYLGHGVVEEPCWLQYMREWGPTVKYDSRSELEKIISLLPFFIQLKVEDLVDMLPEELYREEGPTGPKEKDNWLGDERG